MGSSTETSALRPDPQPVGRDADSGRVVGGLGRRGRRRDLSPWRLAPTPAARSDSPASLCGVVGLETDVRPGQPIRPDRLRQLARSGRAVRGHDLADLAHLLQAIAGGDPLDSTSVDQPVPDYASDARHAARIAPDRRRSRVLRRGARPRGRGRDPRGGAASTSRPARSIKEVSLPHSKYGDTRLLRRGAGGVLEQPGAVRRHDLRPPRGRLHARGARRRRNCRR